MQDHVQFGFKPQQNSDLRSNIVELFPHLQNLNYKTLRIFRRSKTVFYSLNKLMKASPSTPKPQRARGVLYNSKTAYNSLTRKTKPRHCLPPSYCSALPLSTQTKNHRKRNCKPMKNQKETEKKIKREIR